MKIREHDKNCLCLCVEDLSGMCTCGFRENKVRCEKCFKVYGVYGDVIKPICPECEKV